MDKPLGHLRRDYLLQALTEEEAPEDPCTLFDAWFDDALRANLDEPNAMTLATVDAEGQPSGRVVLLKGIERGGLIFYTNYNSRKGRDLDVNPRAAACFYWGPLERQVRIEGVVEKIDAEASDVYFASRPRESRLGAVVSDQSEVIHSRDMLEQRLRELEAQYATCPIPRPPNWGGYRLKPTRIEFWQGRASRLHDRLEYRRRDGGGWDRVRLAP